LITWRSSTHVCDKDWKSELGTSEMMRKRSSDERLSRPRFFCGAGRMIWSILALLESFFADLKRLIAEGVRKMALLSRAIF
jgi:hypothetical protein